MNLTELSHAWPVRFLGLCLIARISYYLLYSLYDNLKAWFFPTDLRKFGEWAVVTGSTDGIGKGFARELARKGVNVILISRSEERLSQTAKEIESDFKVKTLYVKADFSQRDCYEHIEEKLKNLDIGILVNNVGIAPTFAKRITKYTREESWTQIDINCGSYVMMSQMILPQMKKKKKGLIVNVSSITAEVGLPHMGTYASTKSFIKMFSVQVQEEVKKYNIKVICLIPGLVYTKLLSDSKFIVDEYKRYLPILTNVIVPDVKDFTRYAINMLNSNYKVVTGYWGHTIITNLMSCVPLEYRIKILTYVNPIRNKND